MSAGGAERLPGEAEPAAGDTIAAVAVAPGRGSWSILRLSGPGALEAAAGLLGDGEPPLDGAAPFKLAPVSIDWKGVAVPGRAVVFRAPRSYTGEDLVEIAVPGAPPLVAALLSSLLAAGLARPARPGEFTLRAFLSGRLDLSQAEGVAALIHAGSEAEGRAAERQLRGELRSRIEAIGREIVDALALVEAALDFPDEDLPRIQPAAVLPRIASAQAALDALRSASALRLPDRGALRVALAGFPNAGKSSLLNALLKRPAAIVADLAGTTRDPVRGTAPGPGGRLVEWIDLAGFEAAPAAGGEPDGAAPEGVDLAGALARLTRRELDCADIVAWVADASSGPRLEGSLAAFRALSAPRKVLVLSKSDLLGPASTARLRSIGGRPVLVSAREGEGLDDLLGRVLEGGGDPEAAQFLITARQEAALVRARGALERAGEALAGGRGYELVAVDLREGLLGLHEITGREVGERVLEAVFGRFCIGK